MYWSYGSFYLALALDALEQALDTDLGLTRAHPGLAKTGDYILHAHGPDGMPLTYADANRDRKAGSHDTAMMFFADRFDNPLLAGLYHHLKALPENQGRITVWDLLWFVPGDAGESDLPLDAHFKGHTPLAVWRSAWNDPDALYVSLVGGDNPGPHGHLDLGTFELRALGEAWIIDAGKDDYGLPGYWESEQDGRRWTYFNLGSQGHSVPMIGGKQQHIPARADITGFQGGDTPGATIDLSAAYATARLVRQLELLHQRGSVQVTDHISHTGEAVRWGLTLNPEAEVAIDGNKATLSLNGKQLRLHTLAPDNVTWVHQVVPPQAAGDKQAAGGSRLFFEVPERENEAALRISVWFEPVGDTPLPVPVD
jgi:hypothetical protein